MERRKEVLSSRRGVCLVARKTQVNLEPDGDPLKLNGWLWGFNQAFIEHWLFEVTGSSKFQTMVFLHLMVKISIWILLASRELSFSPDHFVKRKSSVSMDPGYSFEYHPASWRI